MATLVALETGMRETGWAVFIDGNLWETGAITCPKGQDMDVSRRVKAIVQGLDELVQVWQPQEVAYKEPFRNQWPVPGLDDLRTALADWARRHNLSVYLYTPREVRAGIVGKANAPKEDLAYAIMKRCGLVGVAKSTVEWEAVAAGDYHMQCLGGGPRNR